jgi:anti-sigma factor RsiW
MQVSTMYKIPDTRTCERENDLVAFLHGEIDERAGRDFERHLLSCAECESELGAFKQIRSSVVAWRQESLSGAGATSNAASPARERALVPGKPSAIAAIRKFFEFSPLWMKGSVALAAVLFCVFSVLAVSHLFERPKPVVASEKQYTQEDLEAKIQAALKSGRQDDGAQKHIVTDVPATNGQQVSLQRRGTNRSNGRVANPKVGRAPLTKLEREQLAADLRLVNPQDDLDLDLFGDGNNQ